MTTSEDWWSIRNRKDMGKAELEAVTREATLAAAVAPFVSLDAALTSEQAEVNRVRVRGTNQDYLLANGGSVGSGRFLTEPDVELSRSVLVLGPNVADRLFPGVAHDDVVGRRVRVHGRPFTVIGVLARRGRLMGLDLDTEASLPWTTFLRDLGAKRTISIAVAAPPGQVQALEDQLVGILRRVRRVPPGKPDDFSVNRQEQFLRIYNQLTGALYGVAVGVGLITLLVGGIGIMNIMLVSVTERTREIGVRRALGARRRTILLQFLIESSLVAALGRRHRHRPRLRGGAPGGPHHAARGGGDARRGGARARLLGRGRAALRELAGLAGRPPRSGGGAEVRMTGFLDNLAMALGTLKSNPLRSALTLLGIVIGAMTVVAMMSLTEGLRLKVKNDLAFLGSDSFAVTKWPAPGFGDQDWDKFKKRRPITRELGEALRGLPHVAGVSIEEAHDQRFAISTAEKATRPIIEVVGAVPDLERARSATLAAGRFISDSDIQLARRVAVLGFDVADVLFPAGDALGQTVRVQGPCPSRSSGWRRAWGACSGWSRRTPGW